MQNAECKMQNEHSASSRLVGWAWPAWGETPARDGLAPANRLSLPIPIVTITN